MRTDGQLKTDVTDELMWEPTLDSAAIQVAVSDGVVTLTGSVPHFAQKWAAERAVRRVNGVKAIAEGMSVNLTGVHKKSDTDVARAVANALEWHVWVPGAVKATVENGWVTLTGAVAWGFERQSAEHAVKFLCGVSGVTNNILITPSIEAKAIKATIESALMRDVEIDSEMIRVAASGGKVTLTGSIPSWDERDKADYVAWCAPGVSAVENDLVVTC